MRASSRKERQQPSLKVAATERAEAIFRRLRKIDLGSPNDYPLLPDEFKFEVKFTWLSAVAASLLLLLSRLSAFCDRMMESGDHDSPNADHSAHKRDRRLSARSLSYSYILDSLFS